MYYIKPSQNKKDRKKFYLHQKYGFFYSCQIGNIRIDLGGDSPVFEINSCNFQWILFVFSIWYPLFGPSYFVAALVILEFTTSKRPTSELHKICSTKVHSVLRGGRNMVYNYLFAKPRQFFRRLLVPIFLQNWVTHLTQISVLSQAHIIDKINNNLNDTKYRQVAFKSAIWCSSHQGSTEGRFLKLGQTY